MGLLGGDLAEAGWWHKIKKDLPREVTFIWISYIKNKGKEKYIVALITVLVNVQTQVWIQYLQLSLPLLSTENFRSFSSVVLKEAAPFPSSCIRSLRAWGKDFYY